ncbi:MAG: hypothetical protein IT375_05365 [Polyangiaceae bacterium]|nr:hypothetical protein [Polyangiaceae bacterium]
MKLRSLVLVSLVAGLSLTACGDDDDSGGGGTGGSGTGGSGTGGSGGGSTGGMAGMGAMAGMGGMGAMGGMAGTGGSGTGGSGTGGSGTGGSGTGGSGTGGSGTGGSGTGGSGTGGTGGGGGNMTPEAFCASYETHCGFGTAEHYPSSAECKTKYAAFSESRKTCANTHLAMAADKTSVHCTHAAGAAPCN